ncbi:F0F1 ATP synthase subunit epsilon [Cellulomonas bogoriensis]|uniref:ATP synthase epsilon chain n=1 Tax=Cellulomonas bogoriensis 69B4 = DSM 16987 TaxID=1386082 RepID=A0A0A0C362_9CELL|nr:F0F1 ATP synthase subunit epsilon [Cellulomonas bogoriensis]KGM13769.1 ATP synthase subunit epsilon [Cellulomonas bogoriensis 69B4 = DSM 16987]
MAHLEVDLVAADRKVWSGAASMLSAPAAEGEIGILPGHAPVLAVLQPGPVRITPVGEAAVRVAVGAGFLSVDHDQVTVVVDSAEGSVVQA